MTMTNYRVIVPDPANGNPFFYVCNTLEELCFIYKFVEDYNLYLDTYTNVTVQRSRTQAEQERAYLFEDDPDYWVPFTDAFTELIKAKAVRL